MFGKKPKCSKNDKKIKGNEVVFIKMRYPKREGITEIKAYLLTMEFSYEKIASDN